MIIPGIGNIRNGSGRMLLIAGRTAGENPCERVSDGTGKSTFGHRMGMTKATERDGRLLLKRWLMRLGRFESFPDSDLCLPLEICTCVSVT